jgi:hypothetical protein
MNRCTRLLLLAALLEALPAQAAESKPPASPKSAAALAGRIFFTVAERLALETKAKTPGTPAAPPPPSLAAPAAARRFDGALWRGNRIVALWFDGHMAAPVNEPAIRLSGGAPAAMLDGRRDALLPGETWPPQKGGARP